jgi:putative zinc finger protein
MLHTHIDNDEIIERYVRGQLAPEERRAFEEHFFGCEECFEKLQDAERFHAGIRDAARRGLLQDASQVAFTPNRATWFRWAFAATACASLVLGVTVGWIFLREIPSLHKELQQTVAHLQIERQARTALEQRVVPAEQSEANVPLVMLDASRAAEEPALAVVPRGAKHVILWIEPGPARYRTFRMEVFTSGKRLVTSLDHLERGPYGGLAASLPADQLPTGDFRITLTGQNPAPASLVGEYRLRIERH